MSAKTRAIYVDKKIILDPGEHGRMILQSDEEMPLAVLWTLAGIILLIATANLAGLLLARSEARQREMGVRLALGAGRARIVRQLLTEGFLITGMGAVAGLTLASAILRILANHLENGLGLRAFDPHLDLGMLVFGVALAIFTGLAFSLPPAIRSSHLNPQASLKGQGANASNRIPRVHFRKVLMTSQIALTTVLLSAAVLFVGTLRNLERVNLGLRTDHVIEFQIDPGLNRYSPAQTVALADRLRDSIAALPGVRSVSAAKLPVLEDWDEGGTIVVEGYVPHPGDHVDVRDNRVGPAYFATMGTPLISGREFTPNDRMGSQKVAVINQKLASLYFAGRNPLGLHIAQDLGNSPRPDIEIVGVVQDSKHSTVRGPVEPYAYFPYAQTPDLGSLAVYVRTNQEPASLAPALRNVVRQADPNLAMFKVRTLVEQVEENTFADRMLSAGSLCIGGLAALLAAIGLYGLMAYVVSRRTHEIGIRRAIGASRASIAWLILREVAWMSGAGLIIGLALAYSTGRLIESRLFGINPSSPFVFAAVAALIAGVVLAAGWLPTRKATRVDPMVALRYE
jgi:predicted permease